MSNSAANGVKPEIIDNINSLLGLRIWRIFNEDRFAKRIKPLPTNQYQISADEVLKLVNTAHDTLGLLLDIRDMIKVDPENQQPIDIQALKSKLEQIVEKRGDIGDFVSRPESPEITATEFQDMNAAIGQAEECLEQIESLPSEKASLPNTNRIQRPNNVGIVYHTHEALMTLRSDFIGKINHIAGSSLRGIKTLSEILGSEEFSTQLSKTNISDDKKTKFQSLASSTLEIVSQIKKLDLDNIIKNPFHEDCQTLLAAVKCIQNNLERLQGPLPQNPESVKDDLNEAKGNARTFIAVMTCLTEIANHNRESMENPLAAVR